MVAHAREVAERVEEQGHGICSGGSVNTTRRAAGLRGAHRPSLRPVAILSISRVSLISGSRNQCTAQQMMSVLAAAQHRVGARREAHEAISCLHLI